MDNLFQKLMLGGSTAALVATMPAIAFAQGGGDQDIEQVVVSASRVQIAGYSQPTPVTVVGAAQLEQDAYANIQDAVRELPAVNAPPASFGQSQGAGSPGTAGLNLINLRNLGSIRTLVLFDSQRVVVSNLTGGVDVTTLPSSIVQRVDIVTGGASAAWGSDAVAGVVNFVLNKNFSGFKASVEGSDTSDGLNRGATMQAAWGGDMFGGRGHIVLAATWRDNPDTTLMVNENWFRGSYWVSNPNYNATNGQPQLIVANDVGLAGGNEGGIIETNPVGSKVVGTANVLRGIEFTGNGNTQQVNFGNVTLGVLSNGGSLTAADSDMPFQTIAGENTTSTLFGYARYRLTDSIQASLQLNYGYFTGKGTAQSFQQLGTSAQTILAGNAFLPAAVAATMAADGITSFGLGTINSQNYPEYGAQGSLYNLNAAQDIAPAYIANRRIMDRGVFTLEGTLGDDWSWNAYYEHSQVRFSAHILGGDAIEANLENAENAVTVTAANRGASNLPLGSIACSSSLTGVYTTVGSFTAQAGCVPLDPFGIGSASPQAVRYITGGDHDFENESLQQDVAEGSMQGTLPWQLPAGPIAVAFGAGYRKEAGSNLATQLGAQAAYATANYTNFPSSSYNVLEGFGEIDAPIIKNGFVDALDVSLAGRMTSYSTSGLVETWKIGATSQLNDDIKLRTTWSVDIRAPQLNELFSPATVNTGSCKDPKTQATVTTVTYTLGNANLLPETARTISGGVVLTPTWIPGLSTSVDWYHINLTGYITAISGSIILNQCNPTQQSTIYPGTSGNPNDPLCSHLTFAGPGGALSAITVQGANIASETTSGMDIQTNYTMDFWEGSLAWAATENYNDEITFNGASYGAGINDYAGTMTGGSAPAAGGPKWKGIASSTYTTGPYSFTVQGRWYGTAKYANNANTGNLSSAAVANLYDPAHFEAPFTAYLDLRASYKWNDNIQIYGAVDNTTNVPPPLIPPTTSGIQSNATDVATNTTYYDLLGRTFRIGVRFNY